MLKRTKILAVIATLLISVLSGCSGNDKSEKVQEDAVSEQVQNTEVEVENESIPSEKEKTLEAILALDTFGDEFIAELMNELTADSANPEIYVVLAEKYMSTEAYENALFVLEVGDITGEEVLLEIRQEMGAAVGLLEESPATSSEKSEPVEEEKVVESEVIAGQYTFEGKNGTYLLTYDPEKIEIKRGGAKPLETIGDVRSSVSFSVENDYACAQEYVDEYVAFLKVIDEQEEIERYDEINVSPITQIQIGNVTVEYYTLQIVGMLKGVEETVDNSYAFINLGTGDCLVISDYYYDKNAEKTGVDFKELLSWVIVNLEVVE